MPAVWAAAAAPRGEAAAATASCRPRSSGFPASRCPQAAALAWECSHRDDAAVGSSLIVRAARIHGCASAADERLRADEPVHYPEGAAAPPRGPAAWRKHAAPNLNRPERVPPTRRPPPRRPRLPRCRRGPLPTGSRSRAGAAPEARRGPDAGAGPTRASQVGRIPARGGPTRSRVVAEREGSRGRAARHGPAGGWRRLVFAGGRLSRVARAWRAGGGFPSVGGPPVQ